MSKRIKTAFRLNGGIGTYISELNYLQYLYDKFPEDFDITVYGHDAQVVNDGLMKGQYFINSYYPRSEFTNTGYDLIIELNWFPVIISMKRKVIAAGHPEVMEYLDSLEELREDPRKKHFTRNNPIFEANIYTYCKATNQNRLTIMDVGGKLGIERAMRFSLKLDKTEESVLSKFDLTGRRFITMQTGTNQHTRTKANPRQWSVEKYNSLCDLIRKKYPDCLTIQLGESAGGELINNADRCLIDQTDFEDLKVILKNSFLHIDGDCGMVHIREALHTNPSIVLYGQIPAKIHDYDDTIFITSDVCKGECGKLFSAWKRRCFIADKPLCMEAIQPETVMKEIIRFTERYESGNIDFDENKKTEMLDEILNCPDFKLDTEWVDGWLSQRKIYAWLFEEHPLKELKGRKLTENGYITVPISDMPSYQYFEGNVKLYDDYMKLNDIYNPGHEHSLERIEALKQSLIASGIDDKTCIVIDGANVILDGVHRASWMMHKDGENAIVRCIKLYGDWKI